MSGHTDRAEPTNARPRAARVSERRRLVATLLATVLAAPLLLVEIAPGADAGTDAALTAHQQPATSPARAVGTLSSDDLATTRLFSTLSVGDELRAEAEAAAVAEEAAADEEAVAAEQAAAAEAQEAAEREAAAERAAARAAAATTTTTQAPPPPPPAATGGPTAAQWAALRQCESSGNYSVVSANGLYYGAYQFGIETWDYTARLAGRNDLVGVQPNLAAPADQDAMAVALYARAGSSPWPHCGRYLN